MTSDWKGFNFGSIRKEAMAMYDQYNMTGARISGLMPQDSLEYWIAVAAWYRAKATEPQTPIGSTRWR